MRYLIFLLLTAVLFSASAQAKEVTLDRILAEHRITVVTAEKPESLYRNLLEMGVRNPNMTTTTELMLGKKDLKDKDSLLFIMNRNKTRRMIDIEENLLPVRTAAIDPNEVILYAAKAQGRNGWDILVSAPNEKWLKWELERLTQSALSKLHLQTRGTILEKFRVQRLCVISNEDKQIATDWISAQNKPGKDAIDWDFYNASDWNGASDAGTDMLFILNSATLDDKTRNAIAGFLPKATQDWLQENESNKENSAAGQTIIQNDSTSQVYAVAAPSTRQLQRALQRYEKLENIPEALERTSLADLRGYGRMVVIARTADADKGAEYDALNKSAGSLTSEMASRTGFTCINRQDLKELALETYLNNLPDENSALRSKLENATAVAIFELSDLHAETTYSANEPVCMTAALPPFSESKPSAPREPHPNDKPLFSAHTYDEVNGSRANDPDYIRDHNDYHNVKLPKYQKELRRWEEDRDIYERRRQNRDMEWVVSTTKTQVVKVTGNLRIYDLSSGEVDQVGKIVFSCPVSGSSSKSSTDREDRVTIRGEYNRPGAHVAPGAEDSISDHAVVTDALRQACAIAVDELMSKALLPVDVAANGQK